MPSSLSAALTRPTVVPFGRFSGASKVNGAFTKTGSFWLVEYTLNLMASESDCSPSEATTVTSKTIDLPNASLTLIVLPSIERYLELGERLSEYVTVLCSAVASASDAEIVYTVVPTAVTSARDTVLTSFEIVGLLSLMSVTVTSTVVLGDVMPSETKTVSVKVVTAPGISTSMPAVHEITPEVGSIEKYDPVLPTGESENEFSPISSTSEALTTPTV